MFLEHMRHTGLELPDRRMNINFSFHFSFIFKTAIFLQPCFLWSKPREHKLTETGKQTGSELLHFHGALVVLSNKQFDWLDGVAIGVVTPTVYSGGGLENSP